MGGFKDGEGRRVRLGRGGVRAAGREGNRDDLSGAFRRLFNGGAAREDDEIGQGDLGTARPRAVELLLNGFEPSQNPRQFRRLVDLPILLGGEANARAVRAAALVRARKVAAEAQAVMTRSEIDRSEARIRALRLEISAAPITG